MKWNLVTTSSMFLQNTNPFNLVHFHSMYTNTVYLFIGSRDILLISASALPPQGGSADVQSRQLSFKSDLNSWNLAEARKHPSHSHTNRPCAIYLNSCRISLLPTSKTHTTQLVLNSKIQYHPNVKQKRSSVLYLHTAPKFTYKC